MRISSILSVLPSASALVIACAPSAPPSKAAVNSGTVSGTVGAATLATTSVVSNFVPIFPPGGAPAVPALRILLSDKGNVCGVTHFASSTVLDIRLVATGSVQLGTFPIINAESQTPADGQAEADFNSVDGNCGNVVAQTATTGTLTLKGAHFSGPTLNVAGSVDVTFAGGHLTGDFNALYCDTGPADASGGPDAGAITTCTP